MNCKKCGKPIKDGAAFCGNCGEPFIVHEKTDYQDNHLSYVIIQKSNNVAENKKSIENTGYHNPDSKAKPPNSKWPLSVRILMTISLIILIVEFPCLKTAGSFSYRYSGWYDALPFISSIIAIIYFLISKKRVLLSIVPLFLIIIWYPLWEAHTFRQKASILSIIALTAFAILFSVLAILPSNKRSIVFPIIMTILIIPIIIPFFLNFYYGFIGLYGFMISFLIAYTIAAFSLLPMREKNPLPAYQPQQAINRFCPSCGIQYTADKKFCDQCGGELKEMTTAASTPLQSAAYPQANPTDAPSGGYAVLGFFIPIVGLILFLTWKDSFPLRARSAGKGALIGFIVGVILSIGAVIIPFIIAGSIYGL